MSCVGPVLLKELLVSNEELEEAARQQSLEGGTLGLHLIQAGVVKDAVLKEVFVGRLGFEPMDESELALVSTTSRDLLPPRLAVSRRVVPVEKSDDQWLTVAMADPSEDRTVAEVSRHTGCRLVVKVVSESGLSLALKRLYGAAKLSELADTGADGRPSSSSSTFSSGQQDRADGGERVPSLAGSSRPPVLLEGRYDRIPADQLPPDVDAGYIPLTKMKQRRPGNGPSEAVIQVKSVDLGPSSAVNVERANLEPHDGAASSSASVKPTPSPGGASKANRQAPAAPSPRRAPTLPMPPGPARDVKAHPSAAEVPPSLADGISRIRDASGRAEAVSLVLDFLGVTCNRVIFLTATRGVVEGYEGRGTDLSSAQVDSVWIPLSSASFAQQVLSSGAAYVGPPGGSRTDAIFYGALGGIRGDCIVVPVCLGDRAIAVLYGDDFSKLPPPVEDLHELGQAVAELFGRLIREQQPAPE